LSTNPAQPPTLPLNALLSQALVAFTIEFDNEFEHRMPHRTTDYGPAAGGDGPWLVSLVMWANCMRLLPADGLTVSELTTRARTRTNLAGMRRWGYISVKPEPGGNPKKPGPQAFVRPTRKGVVAQQTWQPLDALIEQRWQERFGAQELARLKDSLRVIAGRFGDDLPDCLPILGFGLSSIGKGSDGDRFSAVDFDIKTSSDVADLPLWALLSRVLLAFATEYDQEAPISLAVAANILRVLGDAAVPLRDLPALSGVSKEAIAMAVGFLDKRDCLSVEPIPAPGRGQSARLTEKGARARSGYLRREARIEQRWLERYGATAITALRQTLEPIVVDREGGRSPLFGGLEPYPDGWRARLGRRPTVLPHFPIPLHRGGYPDGS